MNMLYIRLPEQIDKRLSYLANQTGRTKAYYVSEALIEHLDELEDMYSALNRLEKPAKHWSLEELENNSDVDG